MKKRKQKKFNGQKTLEQIRRENEIAQYGKLVSLRPSKEIESKKSYKRKWNLKDYED